MKKMIVFLVLLSGCLNQVSLTEKDAIELVKMKFPEVEDIEKCEADFGCETDIEVEKTKDGFELTFFKGWGDCPAGCISRHYWVFEVSAFKVLKITEYGDPFEREYLFIEFWKHTEGELLEGERVLMMIDFPTYIFNEEERVLEGMMDFELDDSLLAIFGIGQSLGGDAGGGAASMLYPIYEIPFERNELRILEIRKERVVFQFMGEMIILKSQESFEMVLEEIKTEDWGKMRYKTTFRIKNYGFLKEENIKKWGSILI
ncbi:MAG: hypothetical protein ACE5K0_02545 [Candidatus Methanofastidiosia archaeon]